MGQETQVLLAQVSLGARIVAMEGQCGNIVHRNIGLNPLLHRTLQLFVQVDQVFLAVAQVAVAVGRTQFTRVHIEQFEHGQEVYTVLNQPQLVLEGLSVYANVLCRQIDDKRADQLWCRTLDPERFFRFSLR